MKISEIDELFEKCWKGYEKKGMKTMFGKRVPNCVKKESVELDEGSLTVSKSQLHDIVVDMIKDMDFNEIKKLADIARLLGKEVFFTANGKVVVQSKDFDFNEAELNEMIPLAAILPAVAAAARVAPAVVRTASAVKSGVKTAKNVAKAGKEIASDIKDTYTDLDTKKYRAGNIPESQVDEDLRAWFGKGKKGGAGGGGWDRYNTKGERVGKCGDSKPGEGKPKCLSKSRAASLRASGGKKAIANAVKRKKAKDPNQNRRGKAKNVNSHPKK